MRTTGQSIPLCIRRRVRGVRPYEYAEKDSEVQNVAIRTEGMQGGESG